VNMVMNLRIPFKGTGFLDKMRDCLIVLFFVPILICLLVPF
jgi:hypothetical protein